MPIRDALAEARSAERGIGQGRHGALNRLRRYVASLPADDPWFELLTKLSCPVHSLDDDGNAMDRTPDATEVDPTGHKIVFENEHVRVLEVRSAQGEKLSMHSHPCRVVVAVGPYRLKSVDARGVESILDRRPGEATWVDQEEHTAEILIGPTHVIEVEIKNAQ